MNASLDAYLAGLRRSFLQGCVSRDENTRWTRKYAICFFFFGFFEKKIKKS
jgi:hypothetical protein